MAGPHWHTCFSYPFSKFPFLFHSAAPCVSGFSLPKICHKATKKPKNLLKIFGLRCHLNDRYTPLHIGCYSDFEVKLFSRLYRNHNNSAEICQQIPTSFSHCLRNLCTCNKRTCLILSLQRRSAAKAKSDAIPLCGTAALPDRRGCPEARL